MDRDIVVDVAPPLRTGLLSRDVLSEPLEAPVYVGAADLDRTLVGTRNLVVADTE